MKPTQERPGRPEAPHAFCTATRRALLRALGAYCVFVAVVVLLPTGTFPSAVVSWVSEIAESVEAPSQTTVGGRVEFALNALMVAPISALGSLVWPRWNWRDWTAVAFLASASVELIQGLFLLDRSATFVDVCANTLGGLLGAATAALARRVRWHR